jgi:hypothetical protein
VIDRGWRRQRTLSCSVAVCGHHSQVVRGSTRPYDNLLPAQCERQNDWRRFAWHVKGGMFASTSSAFVQSGGLRACTKERRQNLDGIPSRGVGDRPQRHDPTFLILWIMLSGAFCERHRDGPEARLPQRGEAQDHRGPAPRSVHLTGSKHQRYATTNPKGWARVCGATGHASWDHAFAFDRS